MSPLSRIESFRGDYEFLSNFFREPDGTCVEIEYQRSKCKHQEDRSRFDNLTPLEAKRHGHWLKEAGRQRDDWYEVNVEIMWFYVAKKFADHDSLWTLLLRTHNTPLIEGNNWHDTFWGVCNGLCFSAKTPRHKPQGANGHGEILMLVRSSQVPDALQSRYRDMIPF